MTATSPSPDLASVPAGESVLLVAESADRVRDVARDALARADGGVLLLSTRRDRPSIDAMLDRGLAPDALAAVDASGAEVVRDGIAGASAVEGPGSLSTLGVDASDQLDRLGHRYETVTVGLHTVTDHVETVGVPPTFRFLHVLTGRVRTADATLLATLDASVHEEDTRRTIAELFDRVVCLDEDGD